MFGIHLTKNERGASTTLTVSLYTIFVNTAPLLFWSTAAMLNLRSCG